MTVDQKIWTMKTVTRVFNYDRLPGQQNNIFKTLTFHLVHCDIVTMC